MASNAQSSSESVTSQASNSSTLVESRPQAGPLPLKRGEIGFRRESHGGSEGNTATDTNLLALPARHPADRDNLPTPSNGENNNIPPSEANAETTSTHSKRTIISFFSPRNVPTYGGIRLTTILVVVLIFVFMGGSITALVTTVKRIGMSQNSDGGNPVTTAMAFIYVIFAVALLAQLIVLERWVFTLRAERYAYLHPGEMLPSSRRFSPDDNVMGLSPWNRPPLPTYAATLAASGYGTGDVEDHIIAAPAPPAYGNTRGSTLILAGYLRDSLRAQRPRSEQSQRSQRDADDRPKSYASRDEEWEEIRDAERAINLEATLATLEEGRARE